MGFVEVVGDLDQFLYVVINLDQVVTAYGPGCYS
jgi:hypothetical protein